MLGGAGLRFSVLGDRIRQGFDSCAVCAGLRLSVLHGRIRRGYVSVLCGRIRVCYMAGYEEVNDSRAGCAGLRLSVLHGRLRGSD